MVVSSTGKTTTSFPESEQNRTEQNFISLRLYNTIHEAFKHWSTYENEDAKCAHSLQGLKSA